MSFIVVVYVMISVSHKFSQDETSKDLDTLLAAIIALVVLEENKQED